MGPLFIVPALRLDILPPVMADPAGTVAEMLVRRPTVCVSRLAALVDAAGARVVVLVEPVAGDADGGYGAACVAAMTDHLTGRGVAVVRLAPGGVAFDAVRLTEPDGRLEVRDPGADPARWRPVTVAEGDALVVGDPDHADRQVAVDPMTTVRVSVEVADPSAAGVLAALDDAADHLAAGHPGRFVLADAKLDVTGPGRTLTRWPGVAESALTDARRRANASGHDLWWNSLGVSDDQPDDDDVTGGDGSDGSDLGSGAAVRLVADLLGRPVSVGDGPASAPTERIAVVRAAIEPVLRDAATAPRTPGPPVHTSVPSSDPTPSQPATADRPAGGTASDTPVARRRGDGRRPGHGALVRGRRPAVALLTVAAGAAIGATVALAGGAVLLAGGLGALSLAVGVAVVATRPAAGAPERRGHATGGAMVDENGHAPSFEAMLAGRRAWVVATLQQRWDRQAAERVARWEEADRVLGRLARPVPDDRSGVPGPPASDPGGELHHPSAVTPPALQR